MESRSQSKLIPKKSRAGCTTCKVRRVKCDEEKPVCGNCKRRFVYIDRCEYRGAHLRRSYQARKILPSPNICTIQAPHPPSVRQVGQRRSQELFLIHHYASVVANSMPHCDKVSSMNMWQRVIPQIAFESEVVLNPMLALSALHFYSHNMNNSSMALAVSYYLDRTLFHHRQALASPDKQLTEQTWLSAILLTTLSWLFAHEVQESQTYELPVHAWKMKRGIYQLYASNRNDLRQMGYGWFGHEGAIQTLLANDLSWKSKQDLIAVEDDMIGLFRLFELGELDKEMRDIYNEARDYVLNLYRAYYAGVSSKSLRRFIGTMTNRCQDGFQALLLQHDPLAMSIMARCLVLLKGMEEEWWMDGRGRYEVVGRSVRGMKSLMPEAIASAMDWPCNVLDGRIILTQPGGLHFEEVDYEPFMVIRSTL